MENTPIAMVHADVFRVVTKLPNDVREIAKHNRIWLAGGFVRDVVAHEQPSDIDVFGTTVGQLEGLADNLVSARGVAGQISKLYKTDNALTVLTPGRTPVQFIKRWTFNDVQSLIASFDYTIAQAAVYVGDGGKWTGVCDERFYPDLAAKRLVYTAPKRDEEVGGSLMRMRKFLGRGYVIQAQSMAKVIARLVSGVNKEQLEEFQKIESHNNDPEMVLTRVLLGLLREVDPLTRLDEFELSEEEHALQTDEV